MSDFRLFYTLDLSDPPRYHHRRIDAEYFDWLFSQLQGTGLTVLFRCNLAGRAYYPSQHLSPFDHGCVDHRNSKAAVWHRVAEMLEGCDPLAEAVRAARRHGVPIWAWWNWNEFQCVRRGWVSLIDPLWHEHPRKFWCTRDGSRFYHGIPDFGDDQVRQRLAALAQEVLGYGVEGIYLSTRSHSWSACWDTPRWDRHLEPFGFNDSVVEAYRKRHGVDIRYDDYDQEAWLRIKGEQFSTVLARTGSLVHQVGGSFIVGISPRRYELCVDFDDKLSSGRYLNLYKDWESWVAEGSVDGICSESGQSTAEDRTVVADISIFRKTLEPDFPLYSWACPGYFHQSDGTPFALESFRRVTVEQMLKQLENARDGGAAGVMIHQLYHFTASDTAGRPIGQYGVLPRTEYLDGIREWTAAAGALE